METPGSSGNRSPRAGKGHFARLRGSITGFPKGPGHPTGSLGPGAQGEEEAEAQNFVPRFWKAREDRILPPQ